MPIANQRPAFTSTPIFGKTCKMPLKLPHFKSDMSFDTLSLSSSNLSNVNDIFAGNLSNAASTSSSGIFSSDSHNFSTNLSNSKNILPISEKKKQRKSEKRSKTVCEYKCH